MNGSTSTLIAVGYDDRKAAEEALERVYGLTYDGVLELVDAVVVTRDADGEVKLSSEHSRAAVIALVDEADMEKILPRLGGHDGHVIRTSLSQADEDRLRAAVAREEPLEG